MPATVEEDSTEADLGPAPTTDSEFVMAAQCAHDVVNQVRSVSDSSLSDASANTTENVNTAGNVGGDLRPAGKAVSGQDFATSPRATSISESKPYMNGFITGQTSQDPGHQLSSDVPEQASPTHEMTDGEGTTIQVNGDKADSTEDSRLQASAEHSISSDTEMSRHENGITSNEKDLNGQGHKRSDSLKKPASFKAVSVTKNFLAKAAVGGASPAAKLSGDKAAAVSANGQATAPNSTAPRPRLVAKSGSTLRDGGLRASTLPAARGRGAPLEVSQVWNKNRPVQPAAPKQFTDEELKQQYGIHLATRLQADESGKEAKWADIDDDDDDWAPETIEWNDGTKITLPTQEEQVNPAPPRLSAPAPKENATVVEKPMAPAPPKPRSDVKTDPTKGSANGQSKSGGLILKGAPEKPMLVAKPVAPTPVKSPWAPLPPVEKIPPIPTNPQPSQSGLRVQKDQNSFDTMPALPSPAKEIAADDFNRSWRENSSGANRELFNSSSGRYEPVNENRRGSIRNEQNFRQPSVLQRPAQNDQKGPAEPSAAFQTNRSSGQDMTWGRRRGSSNVSGGSGNMGRRMSVGKGQDLHSYVDQYSTQRMGSHQGTFTESPSSSHSPSQHQNVRPLESPSDQTRAPAQPGTQANRQGDQKQQDQQPAPEEPQNSTVQQAAENPLELQKKIMRESRELARKRRMEQEQREEAERKERIRKKLEALGPPPPSQKKGNTEAAKSTEPSTANQTEGTRPSETKNTPQQIQSPPKPPVPEVSGEVKQYGLMKVHHPEVTKKPALIQDRTPKQTANDNDIDRSAGPRAKQAESARPIISTVDRENKMPGDGVEHAESHSRPSADVPAQPLQERPWKKSTSDAHARKAWGDTGVASSSILENTVWGPPGPNKALGNGIFTHDYPDMSTLQGPDQVNQLPARPPGTIGPPNTARDAGIRNMLPTASEARPQNPSFAEEIPSSGVRPVSQAAPLYTTTQSRIGPKVVPPQGTAVVQSNILSRDTAEHQKALSAWKSLPGRLERADSQAAAKANREYAARLEEETRTGKKPDDYQPAFKETWKQVIIEESSSRGQRKVVGVSQSLVGVGEAAMSESTEITLQLPSGPASSAPNSGGTSSVIASRASRFFPHTADVASLPHQLPVNTVSVLVEFELDSSPPPESTDHPVYDGDASNPLVHLPTPKPTVRLPPASQERRKVQAAPASPASVPTRPTAQSTGPGASWQDRIYGLVGRRPSIPIKSQALAVNSASKAPLESPIIRVSATVSLPAKHAGSPVESPKALDQMNIREDVMSRAMDEALFEEREFASRPTVKLPPRAPGNAWVPVKASLNPRARMRSLRPVQTVSVEPHHFQENRTAHGMSITVRLPGWSKSRFAIKPHPGDQSKQQRTSPPTPQWKDRRKNNRSRESSGNITPSRPVPNAIPGNAMPVASATNTNTTWARRVSGTVH